MKRALITGITGQDGSYLADFLSSKGYEVHGLIRRASGVNTSRLSQFETGPAALTLHYGDLADGGHLTSLIHDVEPDEVYHLGAQSHVQVSFDLPEYTGDVTALGTVRLLEAIRRSRIDAKFYQASSSEMFGSTPPPQSEDTTFRPRSPYAAAKVYAYWLTAGYREGYGLFACNGILFNHESPRRGETFVTRKVTRTLANIVAGREDRLRLGNLDARRDWGFAPEYVECQWLILQQERPDDFVIGTGESHSVREFTEIAFRYVGIELEWVGHGPGAKGIVAAIDPRVPSSCSLRPGATVVSVDRKHFRPTEVDYLMADSSKAATALGWKPKIGFEELVKIMLDHDLDAVDLEAPGEGCRVLSEKGFDWTQPGRGVAREEEVV